MSVSSAGAKGALQKRFNPWRAGVCRRALTVLSLLSMSCARNGSVTTVATAATAASARGAESEWIEQEPLRAEVLRALLGADEFVRRCTSGTHRVYAVAVVLFEPGGGVVSADIDTGDPAANECARRLLSVLRVERFRAPSFAVAFPFRVYSNKEERVREVTAGIEPQMTFAPELCLWGASGDPRCRDEREANAVDCAADRR